MPASIKNIKSILNNPQGSCLLAKWPGDRLFYIVKLNKVDEQKRKARVVYEDFTETWVNLKDLQIQFNELPEDEFIVCCVCDSDESEAPNVLIICDTCQQAYHQKCHEPQLSDEVSKDNIEWNCNTCQLIFSQAEDDAKPKVVKTASKINNNNTSKRANDTIIIKRAKDKIKPTVADKHLKAIKTKLPRKSAKGSKAKENETPSPSSSEMMDVLTQDDDDQPLKQ